MNIKKAEEKLITWRKILLKTGIVSEKSLCISFRCDKKMVFIPMRSQNDSCSEVGVMDIENFVYRGNVQPGFEDMLHCAIFKNRRDLNVLIHTDQMNIFTSCKAGHTIPPLLDDFAQLVGVSAKIVDYQSLHRNKAIKKIIKSLTRRNAVLLSDRFAICGGKDFDDAVATAQVLEKGCKANIETKCLGGGIRINKIEAYLMRLVYLFKYSKLK